MILETILPKSKNKNQNHFIFNSDNHTFTFFKDKEKLLIIDDNVSVATALVEYFQQLQLFPPYKSWSLLDAISDYESDYGAAYVSSELLDFEFKDNGYLIHQLFEKVGCRVVEQGFEYAIFDSDEKLVVLSNEFYVILCHYLIKANLVKNDILSLL